MPTETYRAMQVVQPGQIELVRRPIPEPPPAMVRLRVEACGVCRADSLTIEGKVPVAFPRVPGHEVVGRVDALGAGVDGWSLGQRVGVGFLGGPCGACEFCRRGDFVNCQRQPVTGISQDGGYADIMLARPSALVRIPDDLDAAEAAPLLCAGLATFNALRNSPARAGDLVAIHGIGGLGHLAVQFARHMGFRVAAIARGPAKADLALRLGAHHYIDASAENPAKALQKLGGASLILATLADSKAMSPMLSGLRPRGRLLVLGGAAEPIEATPTRLFMGSRVNEGAMTGSAIDGEDTMAFSLLQDIHPMIETVPLEQAEAAYRRMMASEARFRMVLTTGQ